MHQENRQEHNKLFNMFIEGIITSSRGENNCF